METVVTNIVFDLTISARQYNKIESDRISVYVPENITYEFNGGQKLFKGNFLACPVFIDTGYVRTNINLRLESKDNYPVARLQKPKEYYDPILTDVIYRIEGNFSVPIDIQLDLNSVFLPSEIDWAEIRVFNDGGWQLIDSELSDGKINFSGISGVYGVFLNQYTYSQYTQKMADMLPSWTKFRQSKESVGQQFINCFGVEFDILSNYLGYYIEQHNISTVDVDQSYKIFKADLPLEVDDSYSVSLSCGNIPIKLFEDADKFNLSHVHAAIVDFDYKIIYTKFYYKNGVDLVVKKGPKRRIYTNLKLESHYIWNSIDELGLLLGLTRWSGESNMDFRERILNVFRYPPNATRMGLYNAIARDLGLIKNKSWDDSFDLVLSDNNVLSESILVS